MPLSGKQAAGEVERFARWLALATVFLAALPAIVGWISTPPGSAYYGTQSALDDQMVYAAWIRQAMEGRLLFENRFTTDAQPGLTLNLFFLALGAAGKAVGIPVAMTLARLVLAYCFVRLLARFLLELGLPVFTAKFALGLACFGAGVGFLMWERFGEAMVSGSRLLAPLTGGRTSIDVWQPEAFVFPSMLTNALFMAALCLMLLVLRACWLAQDSWKPVPLGGAAFALLMNVHSYDALLLFLVVVAWFGAMAAGRAATWGWFLRVAVVGACALPPAAWFLHVLAQDAVFQARAATPTFSPAFSQVLLGILPAAGLGVASLAVSPQRRPKLGAWLVSLLLAVLWFLLPGGSEAAQFTAFEWSVAFLVSAGIVAYSAGGDRSRSLLLCWALVGLVALYFPAPFQRKLAMGLVVPWAVLAAGGLAGILDKMERSSRNMVAALALVATCASSLLWLQRELLYVRDDVARTVVHPVFFTQDARRIVEFLSSVPGRKVVLAMPGVRNSVGPGQFARPVIPDLNAVLTGIAGATTYAGHWSETPDYNARRNRLTRAFLAQTPDSEREALIAETGAAYVVQPNPEAFEGVAAEGRPSVLADFSKYGEVAYRGSQLWLVSLRPAPAPQPGPPAALRPAVPPAWGRRAWGSG